MYYTTFGHAFSVSAAHQCIYIFIHHQMVATHILKNKEIN